ncbi:uncharacterized protein LOC131889683 isoform X2 [Tigriopus californicus]|uniref:uncharacterized protein LOC131889683 isoform X2 n=1 Tax=Tigriopus californicus TaxID=6832 RepID=UPI0027DA5DE1|nr:uncharacterized protein LOC131889683 isoform X2 [Tigriopus californicus]
MLWLGSFFVTIVAIYRMINSHDYIHNFDKLEPKMQQVLLNEHDEVALEMFLGGLSILIASLLLIHGLKKQSTSFIFPWIVITIVEMVSFFVVILFRVVHPRRYYGIHVPKLIFAVLCHIFVVYMIQSVYSCYFYLKEKKKLDRSGRYTSTGSLSTEMQSMSNESFEDPKQPSDA